MKYTLRYLCSILAVCACLATYAQEPVYEAMPQRQVFVRFGCDLSRFALPYVGDIGSKGLEFSVDGEIKYNWFPTVEVGRQSLKHNADSIHYKMNGNYFRVGLDYNILKYKHRLDRDICFVGVRFACSSFSQEVPFVEVRNSRFDIVTNIPKSDLNAYWGEAVVGLKGELLKNLYMGVTVRAKMMLAHANYRSVTPYIVPGFGKGYNKINAGISYSIMYAIPIRGAGDDGFSKEEL